jgi:replicative DNA helicase
LNECVAQFGSPGLVILDYLQLLGGGSANRVQELDHLTKECRAIAQEFNVNFSALAQINRAVINRNSKEPTLADLRESGGIEQSADRVIFIYRDEYYNPESSERGKVKLIVAKNRYNAVGAVELLFQPQYSQFKNLAKGRGYEEPPAITWRQADRESPEGLIGVPQYDDDEVWEVIEG